MSAVPTRLAECDSEPIHLLGAIQPVGFLLSVSGDWVILRASANAAAYLGRAQAAVVGARAAEIIPQALLHDIRGGLQQAGESEIIEPLFGRALAPGGPAFAVAVHRSGDEIVLEFIESGTMPAPAPTAVRGMMARIERHADMTSVFREAARQVRALTGYDRVMIYRFGDEGHGEVVGESCRAGLAPFLGLRYPATDIPAQARALYLRSLTRVIADTEHEPVPVLPARTPEGESLDLSLSVLRSVSPTHIEYMRNMGVRASMSVSLVAGGELWGLIACHHATPMAAGLEARLACEVFGQMFSYLLELRARADDAAFEARAATMHHRIAAAFVEPDVALTDLPEFLSGLAGYVEADGIGIFLAGKVKLIGVTPGQEDFIELVKFLNRTKAGRVFATHELAAAHPPASAYVASAAGILSIPISRVPRDFLVFFRRETIATISWAGDPRKEAAVPGARISPRRSFAAWQELVRGTSAKWRRRELNAAETLRLTLIEAVLRSTEISSANLLHAQHRQEILIAELNHRVRNLLGLVRGLIAQAAASAHDVPSLVAGLDGRILSMARAYDMLILGSWQSGSLFGLLRAETEQAGARDTPLLVLEGPDVRLEPKAFSAMAMVVHELATNARKYGALKTAHGQVRVSVARDMVDNVLMTWRESGGPPVAPPARRGFGSMILEQVIPFEVHGRSVPKFPAAGFEIDILLPAAVATVAPEENAAAAADKAAAPCAPPHAHARMSEFLCCCLLVEDNLFIAVDAEDMLQRLGAAEICLARNVAEAMAVLDERVVTFALLDVHLGSETSLPIAEALRRRGIAFMFGTGYGEAMVLPESMRGVPVVTKPYHRAKIETVVAALASQGPEARATPAS